MKTKSLLTLGVIVLLLSVCLPAFAQGTAFTYQGRLMENGAAANGSNDLTFTLYDAANGGATVGVSNVVTDLAVTNGLFTVALDFGAAAFDGNARWLQIAVRPGASAGDYTNLAPRQPITATPYALRAANATAAAMVTGVVPAGQISGTLPLAQLPASVVTNGASSVNLSGTFTGNGAGVTNVDLALNSGGVLSLSGNFVLTSSPVVGDGPASVTAADVNGDGRPDLISANRGAFGGGNTLTVLTNNGSGGFGLASTPVVGNEPFDVTSADVNGDGKPDLISANSSVNTLTVLTNNGSGGFALAVSPGVGARPLSVIAADVNGDGKADLISANGMANTLTVLTNNGNGGFGLAASPGVGSGPFAVTAADVNGDGKPDLISANSVANTLTVLTNNGSGGFALAASPGVGSFPNSVTAADVNGDGKADLISANGDANTLTVLTNNGSGGFGLAASPGAGLGPASVTAVDVNGDGRVDLINVNGTPSTLTVLMNNGNGGFVLAASPAVGIRPFAVTSADVNGDGKPDLISANVGFGGGNTLSVLMNTAAFNGAFYGTFSGNGAGLTNLSAAQIPELDASKITSGTMADALLSANVALRGGGNVFTGDQTIAGNVGIGTTGPQSALHVYSASSPTTIRVQSSGGFGAGRVEFLSDPQGSGSEWRPGYIQSTDNGGFAGGLSFVVNGSGFANRFGEVETMRVVNGRVGIGTPTPVSALHVVGTVTATAFNPPSDRNLKENFAPVSPREVLDKVAALPISRWNFKGDSATPHVGPMAQDFHAAFGLGTDDKHIATVDADGVALAAIQGLNRKVEEKESRIQTLEKELAELKELVARLARPRD